MLALQGFQCSWRKLESHQCRAGGRIALFGLVGVGFHGHFKKLEELAFRVEQGQLEWNQRVFHPEANGFGLIKNKQHRLIALERRGAATQAFGPRFRRAHERCGKGLLNLLARSVGGNANSQMGIVRKRGTTLAPERNPW